MARTEGTGSLCGKILSIPYTYPTASNWVLTKFHKEDLEAYPLSFIAHSAEGRKAAAGRRVLSLNQISERSVRAWDLLQGDGDPRWHLPVYTWPSRNPGSVRGSRWGKHPRKDRKTYNERCRT